MAQQNKTEKAYPAVIQTAPTGNQTSITK